VMYKFWSFDKPEPNSQFHGKYIHNNLIKDTGFTHLQIKQNSWLGGYHPQTPFSLLPSVLNWFYWTPPLLKKIPGYATAA
jgi:hypothetical protein